jgi:hypothetical protein
MFKFVLYLFVLLVPFNIAHAANQDNILHYFMAILENPQCEPRDYNLPYNVRCTPTLNDSTNKVCVFDLWLKCNSVDRKINGFYEYNLEADEFIVLEIH